MRKRIGRPPRTDNPKRVTFRIPCRVRSLLRRLSAKRAVSQSDIVATALEQFIARAYYSEPL